MVPGLSKYSITKGPYEASGENGEGSMPRVSKFSCSVVSMGRDDSRVVSLIGRGGPDHVGGSAAL